MLAYFGFRFIQLLLRILPFFCVYCIAAFLYFFLAYVFQYRKEVINRNLKAAFPEKTEQERKKIRRKFYRYFADLFLEVGKGYQMSRKQADKRFYIENPELLQDFYDKGQSVMLLAGHFNNWEWMTNSFTRASKHSWHVIYKPLKNNKRIDSFVKRSRERHGFNLVSLKNTGMMFRKSARDEKPSAFVFVADQSPVQLDKAYWLHFLNQITGFIHGPEVYSKLFDLPLIYFEIIMEKRGYYRICFKLLAEKPKEMEEGHLTHLYAKALESSILKQNERWLWSHRRWKRQKPKDKKIIK